jgi:hypothetical protein
MPEDLSLALPPSGAAAVHRVDATTSRRVRDQLASGRPDIGLLGELGLRVEFEPAVLVDGLAAWLGPPAGLRVQTGRRSGWPSLRGRPPQRPRAAGPGRRVQPPGGPARPLEVGRELERARRMGTGVCLAMIDLDSAEGRNRHVLA